MPETAELEETIATGQAPLIEPLVHAIAGCLQTTIAPQEDAQRQERTRAAMEKLARVTTLEVDMDADASELRPSSLYRLAAPTDDHTCDAQYVLGKLLGRGGMGEVREAVQTSLGRPVAVKTLRPSTPHLDVDATFEDTSVPQNALKLVHESWVTGLLEHPNILPIHDIALDAHGRPLIVLKRIEGQTWDALIADADAVERLFGAKDLLDWNLRMFMQVCNAIHFAHSRHIIHRDIKPENVMIGTFGEVYVLDWGIALSVGTDYGGRIRRVQDNHEIAGTPVYMAPEMLPGLVRHPLSLQTDVYLLGATLCKILTGKPPHNGETAREVLAQVRISEPVFPPTVASEIADVCRRALAVQPHERYPSAEHLRLAVQDFLQFRGSLQVSEAAQAKLLHIHSLVAAAADDPDAVRSELYTTHGECRFGFQTALQSWPQHRGAQLGLRAADLAVAEFEVHHGDLRAAIALIEHIDDPPAELLATIENRRQRIASARSQALELLELGRDLDPVTGRRTRIALFAILGVVFSIAPLFRDSAAEPDRAVLLMWPIVSLVVVLGLVLVARKAMVQTAINRRFIGALLITLSAQVVGMLLGLPGETLQVLLFFLWFCIASMMVVTLSRWLVPASLGYLTALLLSAAYPEFRFWMMSAAHLTLTLNSMVLWLSRSSGASRLPQSRSPAVTP